MQTEKDGQTLTVTYTYDKEGKLTKTGNLITEKTNPTTTTATGENNSPLTGTDKNTTGSRTDSTTTANTDTATERHYLYDAAVTDKNTLLMAALYDGRDNRIFAMEYTPKLQTKPGEGTAGTAEKTDQKTTQTGIKNRNILEEATQTGTQKETETGTDNTSGNNTSGGTKAGNTPAPEKT